MGSVAASEVGTATCAGTPKSIVSIGIKKKPPPPPPIRVPISPTINPTSGSQRSIYSNEE
jgi:hypothetical protein